MLINNVILLFSLFSSNHFGSHWKLEHIGVSVFYTATDTHGGDRVPVTSWAGPPPFPTVSCVNSGGKSALP